MARALFGLLVVAALGLTGVYTYHWYTEPPGGCCGDESAAASSGCCKSAASACCSETTDAAANPGECPGIAASAAETKDSGCCPNGKCCPDGPCCPDKKDEKKNDTKAETPK
jgi:hypothetical protein